jgi:cellulose synthase operon protein C
MDVRILRAVAGVGAVVTGISILGCESKDAASYVASANAYIAKSDYKAAVIEAKNALQKEPANGEARILLARSLLQTGDPAGAEAEVRKAMNAGISPDRTYPLLARALVAQGQFAKAMTEIDPSRVDNPDTRADVAVDLAIAQAAQGDVKGARSRVDAVIAQRPSHVRGLLLEAQLSGQAGDIDGLRKYVDAALRASPKSSDALLMKAELELASHRGDQAERLMEQAIAAEPDSLTARAALVSLAATTGKLDVAKAQLAKMKELQPQEFRTVYSDALVAFASADYARARQSVQRLLAVRPDHLPSQLLAGLVDLQLGSFASAEEALRKVIARLPYDPVARRGLATVYLRTGRAPQAVETAEQALRHSPDDPALLRIAGEAYLANGAPEQAAGAYEHANAVDKSNVASQVRLAQVRFATGDTARAFSDLEAIASSESSIGQADLALFAEHLKRREYDKALAVVDKLETKAPESPLPANLRGTVFLAKRDLQKARASFEKALELKADFTAAAASLASIDIQEGKVQAARDRYDKLIAKNPKNVQLLLASAELSRMSGAQPNEVRAAYDKAVAASPSSVPARMARIRYEVSRRDIKTALQDAQSATTAVPNDIQLTEMLARVQMMNKDMDQAVETLKQLAMLQPENPAVLLTLADAQRAVKDYGNALESARQALKIKPNLPQAWGMIARIYVASGRPDDAVAEARKLQKEQADKAVGYALEGEIFVTQKKWPEAAKAFRAALTREPVPGIAVRLYSVLRASGKQDEASAMADRWIKEHPTDVVLIELLAQENQQRKDYAAAVDGYMRVLDIAPDNVAALNNLAWIMVERNDPKAVEYAERAHRLAPFNPSVLDTLGWARARSGDPKRGTELLRMALALSPASNEIRLHLGKALMDSGDKAQARETLAELSKLDKDSPVRTEAEKILATQ